MKDLDKVVIKLCSTSYKRRILDAFEKGEALSELVELQRLSPNQIAAWILKVFGRNLRSESIYCI
jgi:hypothetical protein